MEAQKAGIIYCRVSSKEQVESTSLSSQEKACLEYAKKHSIKILKTYIEEGESAKTANRTEFQKAIKFCGDKKNKSNHFIVYKLDRFTRSQEDHAILKGLFKRINVKLLSVTEQFDETPMGKAMEGVAAIFAQLDNDNRSERCSAGMLERLKQGVWQWQAPLGYKRLQKGENIVPDSKTSPLIRLGFEEYAKGIYTYKSIAQFLSDRGLKTKFGKPVSPQIMEKILKNSIYCGKISTWGGHKGTFEPLITEELFAKCQKGYKESIHANPRSTNNPLFPLRKVTACTECGISLTGSISKGRRGKGYAYYHHYNKACQRTKSIPKETFESKFAKYIKGISPDGEYEKLFKMIVLDEWKNNYKKIDEENAKINREISVMESDRQRIFEFHRSGKYTDEDFEEQRKLVSRRIEEKRNLIKAKWDEEFEMEEVLEYCFSYIRNIGKHWIKAEYPEKISLQKLILAGRIEFDGEQLGTADLRQIYAINQAYQLDKSSLVVPRGVEPLFSG